MIEIYSINLKKVTKKNPQNNNLKTGKFDVVFSIEYTNYYIKKNEKYCEKQSQYFSNQ